MNFKSELIKLLSVGIAVFKPLHVWSSKEATGNEKIIIIIIIINKINFKQFIWFIEK